MRRGFCAFHRLWAHRFVCVLSAAAALLLSGCKDEEPIRSYRTLKQSELKKLVASEPEPARTLAAIVDGETYSWFFKISGPEGDVSSKKADFRRFLNSVRLETVRDERPFWSLPSGWMVIPGGARFGRYASIEIPTNQDERPLTLTVTPLPGNQDLLTNLNRWRRQLNLEPIEASELDESVERFSANDREVVLADIEGAASLDDLTQDAPAARQPHQESVADDPPFKLPPGWSRSDQRVPFSLLTLDVKGEQGEGLATISISGGSRLANVNRWRDQSGLAPLESEQELDRSARVIQAGGRQGIYVEAFPPSDKPDVPAVIGAIFPGGEEESLFFKLRGPVELVADQRDAFRSFVESMPLGGSEDEENGN